MKNLKKLLPLILVFAVVLFTFSGCNTEKPAASPGASDNGNTSDFTYSNGIDNNGFWINIRALDYVTLCDYKSISVPKEYHEISEETIQTEIDGILADFTTYEQVLDRAIVYGDTVNIDYVGTVDGVAFEGGSTEGAGTEVTIGVTSYIDDFLDQLVGHTPGESFDVEVTFPENYGVDNLNGKDATFAVTVNYISEAISPELNDEFMAQNLSAEYGWSTVEEMKTEIKNSISASATGSFLEGYIVENSTIDTVPEDIMKYQENAMVKYYQTFADYYSITIDEYLNTYVGVASVDELLESSIEDNTYYAKLYLVIQAIAEDSDLSVSNEDVTAYFIENVGTDDYSEYESEYGLPYLKLMVLNQTVMDYITETAVLE